MKKIMLISLALMSISPVMAEQSSGGKYPGKAECTVFNLNRLGIMTESFSKTLYLNFSDVGSTLIGEIQNTEFYFNFLPTAGPIVFNLSYTNSLANGPISTPVIMDECRSHSVYGALARKNGLVGVSCVVKPDNCEL